MMTARQIIEARLGRTLGPLATMPRDLCRPFLTDYHKERQMSDWIECDIIARRIIEEHEPVTQAREQITAQIEALQKQLDAMPVPVRGYWGGNICSLRGYGATHYFDIETINGVPHIHGIAMKEVTK